METLELIDTLEDLIDAGTSIPLSGKSLMDKEELLDVIQEIRLKMPDDLKQAKWIKEERQRILQEAQKEASAIIKAAEDQVIAMVNESEIVKKSNFKSQEILGNASKRDREIKLGTRQYVDDILADVEKILEKTLGTLRDNRVVMQQKDSRKLHGDEGVAE